jgi:phosphohistidine phosphatase
LKTLYLLRHAKSSWDQRGVADHDRVLAPRGRKASKLIAAHIRERDIAPDVVLCSTSARTRETLERILPVLGDDVDIRFERAVYAASPGTLLELVRNLGDDVESAMVIGHNPGIQELAVRLARSGEDLDELREKFPTAALATLELAGDWPDLGNGKAKLTAFVKPRDLG